MVVRRAASVAAVAGVSVVVACAGAPAASADPEIPVRGAFIASARWSATPQGWRLSVVPTDLGRVSRDPLAGVAAWNELAGAVPEAITPAMQEQFACHWVFVPAVAPDKPSWNIETWRPLVDPVTLVTSGCNPGGGY